MEGAVGANIPGKGQDSHTADPELNQPELKAHRQDAGQNSCKIEMQWTPHLNTLESSFVLGLEMFTYHADHQSAATDRCLLHNLLPSRANPFT
jgi:hypothetical protein